MSLRREESKKKIDVSRSMIKYYIEEYGLLKMQLHEFLVRKLKPTGVGFVDVDIYKVGTRYNIIIRVQRKRKYKELQRELENIIKEMFNISPTVTFEEIEKVNLNAVAMANRIANSIGRGMPYRHVVFSAMRRIMEEGAAGVEIRIAGKTATKRASSRRFATGLILKVGEHIKKRIREGKAKVLLKSGLLGIKVRIILPEEMVSKEAS